MCPQYLTDDLELIMQPFRVSEVHTNSIAQGIDVQYQLTYRYCLCSLKIKTYELVLVNIVDI